MWTNTSLPPSFDCDEAEALVLVEPFHLAGDGDGGGWVRRDPAWRPRTVKGTLRSALRGPGRVDLEHPVDLWPFRPFATWTFNLAPGGTVS